MKKGSSWKWCRAGYEMKPSHKGFILDEPFREPKAPLFLISVQTPPCSSRLTVPLMSAGHQGTVPGPCSPSHTCPVSPGTPQCWKEKGNSCIPAIPRHPISFWSHRSSPKTWKRAIIKKNTFHKLLNFYAEFMPQLHNYTEAYPTKPWVSPKLTTRRDTTWL